MSRLCKLLLLTAVASTMTVTVDSSDSRAQSASEFNFADAPDTFINFQLPLDRRSPSVYNLTAGVQISTSVPPYSTCPSNYCLKYLFDNSLTPGSPHTEYFLVNQDNFVLIITMPAVPLERIDVTSVKNTLVNRLTDYKIEVLDPDGVWRAITTGNGTNASGVGDGTWVNSSADSVQTTRPHAVNAGTFPTTTSVRISAASLTTYAALNEVRLYRRVASTNNCPTSAPALGEPGHTGSVTLNNCFFTAAGSFSYPGNELRITGPVFFASGANVSFSAASINFSGTGALNLSGRGGVNCGTSGCGLGGLGGNDTGTVSGSATLPTASALELGQGNAASPGGGAVSLTSTTGGITFAAGTGIYANGGPIAGCPTSTDDDGGSGGSIRLVSATSISGAGTLSASGASACHSGRRGGGGGRIALYANSLGATSPTLIAAGGTNSANSAMHGGAGTVYIAAGSPRKLVIDNASAVGASTPLSEAEVASLQGAAGPWTLEVRGGGKLRLDTTSKLTPQSAFIANNSRITHGPNNDAASPWEETASVHIETTGDFTIESGALIDVSGAGYGPQRGPGAPASSNLGGSHGGSGGLQSLSSAIYGDFNASFTSTAAKAGSGGGSTSSGGRGGGLVKVKTGGTLRIDGKILANGAPGTSGQSSGSGSGGFIQLDAAILAGSGQVTADGGGNSSSRGAGGGGRISIFYDSDTSTIIPDSVPTTSLRATLSAAGGGSSLTDVEAGGAGTVFYQNRTTGVSVLVVDNGDKSIGLLTPIQLDSSSTATVTHLVLSGRLSASVPAAKELVISAGGSLVGLLGSSTVRPFFQVFGEVTSPSADWTISNLDARFEIGSTLASPAGPLGLTFTQTTSALGATLEPAKAKSLTIQNSATLTRLGNATLVLDNPATPAADDGTLTIAGTFDHASNNLVASNAPPSHLISVIAGDVVVAATGKILADERGFGTDLGPGRGGAVSLGGSHGGLGGRQVSGNVYGSYRTPSTMGSGGGQTTGGKGGGVIRLALTGTLTLDGQITANGSGGTSASAGGGAGGSIWITTAMLAGSGSIRANGGHQTGDGTGGGGRIAVEFQADSSQILPDLAAPSVNDMSRLSARAGRHGTSSENGSAGTIFLRDTSGTGQGTLIISNGDDAGDVASTLTTPLSNDVTATHRFDQLALLRRGHLRVPAQHILELVGNGQVHTPSVTSSEAWPRLVISGRFRQSASVLTLRHIDIRLEGVFETAHTVALEQSRLTVVDPGAFEQQLGLITVGHGASLVREGTGSLLVKGVPGKLHVLNGGIVSHAANGNARLHVLDIEANIVDIDVGGEINVDGKGYGPAMGPGAGTVSTRGGSHGGLGGRQTTLSSGGGDFRQPAELGSGGSEALGGSGGGAVKIRTGKLELDGRIRANGFGGNSSSSGGGAGGSVWLIVTDLMQGDGAILAEGGHKTNAGAGGGGRISVEFKSEVSSIIPDLGSVTFSSQLLASGGTDGTDSGGAGTIFLRRNNEGFGTLLIDNENNDGGALTNLGSATGVDPYALDQLALCRRGSLRVPTGVNLELAPGGRIETLCGGAIPANRSQLLIEAGGSFEPPDVNLQIQNVDVTLFGDFRTTTNLVLRNSRFVDGGGFQAGLSSLDIGSGATYERRGTAALDILNGIGKLTVAAGGRMGHAAHDGSSHSLWVRAKAIEIGPSGSIDVTGRGFAPQSGTGAGSAASTGGSHGGFGGRQTNLARIYGDYRMPTMLGSGGYGATIGGRGGGAVRLEVDGTLTIDGGIVANGAGGTSTTNAGGGSGGSVLIDADRIDGTGQIQASGGSAANDGAGGGGRIAVEYREQNFSGIGAALGTAASSDKLIARGGSHATLAERAAAGTVFLRDTDSTEEPDGILVIDNANSDTSLFTVLSSSSPNVRLSRIILKNRGNLQIPSPMNLALTLSGSSNSIESYGTILPNLRFDEGMTYSGVSLRMNRVNWLNYGTLSNVSYIGIQSGTWTQKTSSISLVNETKLADKVVIGDGAALEVTGIGPLRVNDLLWVRSGGRVTHAPNTGTPGTTPPLNQQFWVKTKDVQVDAGAEINVTGRGFPRGTGAGSGASGVAGGGGSHGGFGGQSSSGALGGQTTYGDESLADTAGAGGGDDTDDGSGAGGAGGGVVRLEACNEVKIDGVIRADGEAGRARQGGGGSGGAVRIDAGTLSGLGEISARGGTGAFFSTAGGGGGGGGRVAVKAETALVAPEIVVEGGAKGGSSPSALAGNPGSLYLSVAPPGLCGTDPCGGGVCGGTWNGSACVFTNTNGNSCDDGSACTEGDACSEGVCVAGPDKICDDENDCTVDGCDPFVGCQRQARTGACDDNDLCTLNTVCVGEVCGGGSLLSCNDGNECTEDECLSNSGCVSTNNTNGCDDGISCTVGDACANGICVGVSDGSPGCFGVVPGPPEIGPDVPALVLNDGQPLSIDLTGHENDLESGPGANDNGLTWTVSHYQSQLLSWSVEPGSDVLTLTPKSATQPFKTQIIVQLSDGTDVATQPVEVEHKVSDFNLSISASPNPAMLDGGQVVITATLSSALGLPIHQRAVNFTLDSGDGKVFAPVGLTDAQGKVTAILRPGLVSPQVIRATYQISATSTLTATLSLPITKPARDAAIKSTDISVHNPVDDAEIDTSVVGSIPPETEVKLRAKVVNRGIESVPNVLVSFVTRRYNEALSALEAPVVRGAAPTGPTPIAPNGHAVVEVPTILEDNGFYVLEVFVDSLESFPEDIETNNKASMGFWVGGTESDIDPATEGIAVDCNLKTKFVAPSGVGGVKPGGMFGISGRADYAALLLIDPTGALGHAAVQGASVELSLFDESLTEVTVTSGTTQVLPASGDDLGNERLRTIAQATIPTSNGHFPNRSATDTWYMTAPTNVGCFTLKACVKDGALGGCCEEPFCVVPEGPALECEAPAAVSSTGEALEPEIDVPIRLITEVVNAGDFAATNVSIQRIVNDLPVGPITPLDDSVATTDPAISHETSWTPACGDVSVGFELSWNSTVPGDTARHTFRCVSLLPDVSVASATVSTVRTSSANSCLRDISVSKAIVETQEMKAANTSAAFDITSPGGENVDLIGSSGRVVSVASGMSFDEIGTYTVNVEVDGPLTGGACGSMPERDNVSNNVVTRELCADVEPGRAGTSGSALIDVKPMPFRYGEEVEVTARVKNSGTLPVTGDLFVELFSRPSALVDADQNLLGTRTVGASCTDAIEPGTSSDAITWKWTPTHPGAGQQEHRALVLDVDAGDGLMPCGARTESDIAVLAFGMNLAPKPPSLAVGIGQALDIPVEVLHTGALLPEAPSETDPNAGCRVSVTTVDAAGIAYFSESVTIPAMTRTITDPPSENAPYSATAHFSWTPLAADCDPSNPLQGIDLMVDAGDRYAETSEADNLKHVSLPDLVPTSIQRSTVGCTSTLTLTVSNLAPKPHLGAGTWDARVKVIRPDGGTQTLELLDRAGVGNFPLTGVDTTQSGTYLFEVDIDTDEVTSACGEVLESDESNNRFVTSMTLCADPGFASGVTLTPLDSTGAPTDKIQHGVPVDIRATLTNLGSIAIDRSFSVKLGTRQGTVVDEIATPETVDASCSGASQPILPGDTVDVIWEDVTLYPQDGLDTLVATVDTSGSGLPTCGGTNNSTERALWLDLSPWKFPNAPNFANRRDIEDASNSERPFITWGMTSTTLKSVVKLLRPPSHARDPRGKPISNPIFVYPSNVPRDVDFSYVRADGTRVLFGTSTFAFSSLSNPLDIPFQLGFDPALCNPANPIQAIEATVDPDNVVAERIELPNRSTTRRLPNLVVKDLSHGTVDNDELTVSITAGDAAFHELYAGSWMGEVKLQDPDGNFLPSGGSPFGLTGPYRTCASCKIEGTASKPKNIVFSVPKNGPYRATAIVDRASVGAPCGAVPERNELDNTSEEEIWYLCPELDVRVSMRVDPDDETNTLIKAKFRNTGTRPLIEDVLVRLEALDAAGQPVSTAHFTPMTQNRSFSLGQPLAVGDFRENVFSWSPVAGSPIRKFRATVEVQNSANNGTYPTYALCSIKGKVPKTGHTRSGTLDVPLQFVGCADGDPCPPPDEPGCQVELVSTQIDACADTKLAVKLFRPISRAPITTSSVHGLSADILVSGPQGTETPSVTFVESDETAGLWLANLEQLGSGVVGSSLRLKVDLQTIQGDTCTSERTYILSGGPSALSLTKDNIEFKSRTHEGVTTTEFVNVLVGDEVEIAMTVSNGEAGCLVKNLQGRAYVNLGFDQIHLGDWWIDSIPPNSKRPIQLMVPAEDVLPTGETFKWTVSGPSPWPHRVTLEIESPEALKVEAPLMVGDPYSLAADMGLTVRIVDPADPTMLTRGPQTVTFELSKAPEPVGGAVPAGFFSPGLPEPVERGEITDVDITWQDTTAQFAAHDSFDGDVGVFTGEIDLSTAAGAGIMLTVMATLEDGSTGFAQANLLLCGPDDQDCDGSPAPLDCNDLDAAITGPCPPDCTAPAFDPMLVSASASAVDCASASRTIELVIKNEGTADLDGSLSIALFGVAPGASATPFHVLALGDMTGTLPIAPGATGTFSYTLPDPLPTGVTDLWVVLNHGSTTSFVSDGAAGFKSAGVTAECQTEDNMSGALSCLSTGGACTTPSDCAASDTCDTVDCIGGVCTTIEDLTLQTCEENNVVYVTVTNGTQIGFVRCEKTLAGISCDVDGDGKLLVTPGSGGVCAP
jgi:hypothetical protein